MIRQERIERWENGSLVDVRTVTYETPPEFDNEETLTARADSALTDLRTLANGTGNMTAAQLTTAVRLLARTLIALARLVLRRLDATD